MNIKTISNFFTKTQEEYNIILNHLFVVFAFTFPINYRMNSTLFFFILLVVLIRGNFLYYLKEVFQNHIARILFVLIAMHFVWLLGTENLKVGFE